MNKIVECIKKAIQDKLWGDVIIRFRDGKPTLIQISSQEKLD